MPLVVATARCDFLAMAHPAIDTKVSPHAGLLPLFLVEHDGAEIKLYSEKERQDYFSAHGLQLDTEAEFEPVAASGGPATAASGESPASPDAAAPGGVLASSRRVREIELHEVKMLNKHLTRLRDEFSLRAEVLLPREVTGDEPPPRFLLDRDGETYPLLDLCVRPLGAQDRRKRDEDHPVQGLRRDGRRPALGNNDGSDAPDFAASTT